MRRTCGTLIECRSVSDPNDRRIDRRAFLGTTAGALALSLSARHATAFAAPGANDRPTLYNGIRLAEPWPPRVQGLSPIPVTPPYLVDRPAVVPIDVGRQLFVDDFLIEQTSLTRTFHRAEYYNGNPVLWPSTPWEKYDEYAERTKTRSNPAAMPFSDGVFYDPDDRQFKMWYMGGYSQNTCYATSDDGITWNRPALDIVPGTNIVTHGLRDSSTVWLDLEERDRTRRYKMARWYDHYLELLASADGIHWREMGRTGRTGDRTTCFYNPFRRVWVYSLRDEAAGRNRRYWETPDLFANVNWRRDEPVLWTGADDADPRRPEYNVPTELYNLDCVAYESVLLGLFTIFRGERTEREKPNDVCVGFSRDGFHWDRSERHAFLAVDEQVGSWNWANVQSAGGCCLIVGDRLHFYVSGRKGVPGTSDPGVCSTGLATLRRDGFASMDHGGNEALVQRGASAKGPGTLTTRPLRFSGKHLFVNVDAPAGELRVEILDREGRTIAPFSSASCRPIRADSTRAQVTWGAAADLAAVSGETVRFCFHLTHGRLYAFWVSHALDGRSRGYVGAGGPGFGGPVDDGGAGRH
jgi:hypothetical protein